MLFFNFLWRCSTHFSWQALYFPLDALTSLFNSLEITVLWLLVNTDPKHYLSTRNILYFSVFVKEVRDLKAHRKLEPRSPVFPKVWLTAADHPQGRDADAGRPGRAHRGARSGAPAHGDKRLKKARPCPAQPGPSGCCTGFGRGAGAAAPSGAPRGQVRRCRQRPGLTAPRSKSL